MLARLLEVIPDRDKIMILRRVSDQDYDAISGFTLKGALPPGFLDRNQWHVWALGVSLESCTLSWRGSNHCFPPSRF